MIPRQVVVWSALLAAVASATPPPASPLPPGAIARLGNTKLRHADRPSCVTFSPDGKQLITGGQDGTVRVWDVATGEPVNVSHTPGLAVEAVRFTPGGTKLAVVTADGVLRFLDPATLRETGRFSARSPADFDLSANGSLIAVVGHDKAADVTELVPALTKLDLPPSTIVRFHPDGKVVAAGDVDGVVTLYQVTGGKAVGSVRHGRPLAGLAFRPNGNAFATGGDRPDGGVKLWDAGNFKLIAEISDAAGPVTFVGADRLLAAKGTGYGVYDLKRKEWARVLPDAGGAAAVSADGTTLAATGTGGLRVRMWDLTTGNQLHAASDDVPNAVLLAPDQPDRPLFLVSGTKAFSWCVGGPAPTPAGTFPAPAVAAAVGGGRLVVATTVGLSVWDGFDPTRPLPARPTRAVAAAGPVAGPIALSPDGNWIAYPNPIQRVALVDATDGKTHRPLPVQVTAAALAFTPNSDGLIILGRDGFLRRCQLGANPAADREVWKLRVQRGPRGAVAVSPDGRRVAASSSGRLSVADAADGQELFALDRPGIEGTFTAAAFSPDGRLLITALGGTDGFVQVWELATRAEVRRYSTGLGGVTRLAVFPGGTRVASSGPDEAVTVWDLSGRWGKPAPTEEELGAAWATIDSLDAGQAVPATHVLTAGGRQSLGVIRAGIDELETTRGRVNKLLADLGSRDFATREAASRALPGLGLRALPAVLATATTTSSPEVRRRATDVAAGLSARNLRMPAHGLVGDDLRLVRAVAVLEAIGGPEAVALLARVEEFGGPARPDAAAARAKLTGGK